ncbi:MAG: hypothetical protein GX781_06570 [Clostridiales bacterium]|nr:hypothetical protein [Clostridiales bacterium]
MKPPERKEIADIIASPCLVRKDRAGRVLFVSDFICRVSNPQVIKSRLQSHGFICRGLSEKLVLIDWSEKSYADYFSSLPDMALPRFGDDMAMVYGTCRILMEHKAPLEKQDLAVLSSCLRLALLGEKEKLLQTLQSALAAALRERRSPPYHGARLCLKFFGP